MRFKNCLLEISLGETLKEISTGIAKYFWLYYYNARDGGLDYVDHIIIFTFRSNKVLFLPEGTEGLHFFLSKKK